MNNIAYDKSDTSIFPTIIGLSSLGVAGVGAYKYSISKPFRDSVSNFTKKYIINSGLEDPSHIQQTIQGANDSLNTSDAIRVARDSVNRKNRIKESKEILDRYSKENGFTFTNLKGNGIFSKKANIYKETLEHSGGISDIRAASGTSIGDEIISALEERVGGKGEYSFVGDTMVAKFNLADGVKEIKLPFVRETANGSVHFGSSTYSAKKIMRINKNATGEIMNANEYILQMLKNEKLIDAFSGAAGKSKDSSSIARDIIQSLKRVMQDKSIVSDAISNASMTMRIQNALKAITGYAFEWSSASDKEKFYAVGHKVIPDQVSYINSDLELKMGANVSDAAYKGQQVSSRSVFGWYDIIENARNGGIGYATHNSQLSGLAERELNNFRNLHFGGSQGAVGGHEEATTVIGFTERGGPGSIRSIDKRLTIKGRPWETNEKLTKILNPQIRQSPVYIPKNIESPLFNQMKGGGWIGGIGIIDPHATETLAMTRKIGDFKVNQRWDLNINGELITSQATKDGLPLLGQSAVSYKTASGEILKDKTFGDLISDLESQTWEYLDIKEGTHLFKETTLGHARNKEEFDIIRKNKEKIAASKYNLRLYRKDILENGGLDNNGNLTLPALMEGNPVKVGVASMGSVKTSITIGDNSHNMAVYSNMYRHNGIVPEFRLSSDLFKNVLSREADGTLTMSKGRGEYVDFLRGLIAGDALGYGNKKLDDDMTSLVNRWIDIPEIDRGLQSAYTKNGLRFKTLEEVEGGTVAEMIDAYQRIFASTRKATLNRKQFNTMENISSKEAEEFLSDTLNLHFKEATKYTLDQKIGKESIPTESGYSNITEMVKDKDILKNMQTPLLFKGELVPFEHERYSLGKVGNILNLNYYNTSFFQDYKEAMHELNIHNMVSTRELVPQISMIHASLSGNLNKKMIESYEKITGEKLQIKELDDLLAGMKGQLIGPEGYSSLKNPEDFFNSFFSSENNSHGFLIRSINAKGEHGFAMMPSGELLGGGQFLEEGNIALQDQVYAAYSAIRDAISNNGVLQGAGYQKYQERFAELRPRLYKNAQIKAEGSRYEKSVINQFLEDTDKEILQRKGQKWMSQEGNAVLGDLEYYLGNTSLFSRRNMGITIKRQLDDAILASSNLGHQTSALDILNERFGEDSLLSQYFSKYNDSSKTTEALLDFSEKEWKDIQGKTRKILEFNKAGRHEEASKILEEVKFSMKNNSFTSIINREPSLYPRNTLTAFGFVAPELGNSPALSIGKILRMFTGYSDADGDALRTFSLWRQAARKEANYFFEEENKIIWRNMDLLKNKNILELAAEDSLKKASYSSIRSEFSEDFAKNLQLLEKEQYMAGRITKGLTGAATMSAWGTQGYYERYLAGLNKVDNKAMINARAALNTIIPYSGPQAVISKKNIESKIGNENLAAMMTIQENLGNISLDTIKKSVKETGSLDLLFRDALIQNMSPNALRGLENGTQDINLLKNIADMQTHWRRMGDEELKEIHSFLSPSIGIDQYIDQYKKQYGSDFEFFGSIFEKVGINHKHYIDFLNEPMLRGDKISSNLHSAKNQVLRIAKERNVEDINTYILDTWWNQLSKAYQGTMFAVPEEMRASFSRASKTTFPLIEKIKPHITAPRVAMAAAGTLIAMTAMNLLSSDGTPEDPSDLPSYNNPTFENNNYNNNIERRSLSGGSSSNIRTSLLTDSRVSHGQLMDHINSVVGTRGYNSSTVISDGNSPYKEDLYKYS